MRRIFDMLFGSATRITATISAGLLLIAIITLIVLLSTSSGSHPSPPASSRSASAASSPKNAVQEIADRPIWSSPPATNEEAMKALNDEAKKEVPTGLSLKEGVLAGSPAELAKASTIYKEPQLVIGEVRNIQSVASHFLGEQNGENYEQTDNARSVLQIELKATPSTSVYLEYEPTQSLYVPEPSTGDIIIALGRVAALGETHHEAVKAAYLIATEVETIKAKDELDSVAMRRLYGEAARR